MRRFLASLLIAMLVVSPAQAITQWRNGAGENSILGTESISDIDTASYQNVIAPLDNLFGAYRQDALIIYASASTLTVSAGAVVCSNSAGTIRLIARNTTATTVSWTDIDTGTEAVSTTYYVYADMSAVADTTFGVVLSTSSTTPTGVTYYQRLGSFYNDASGNITNIKNDNFSVDSYDSGWFAVTTNTAYTKTHGLGTANVLIQVYFGTAADGSGDVVNMGGGNLDGDSYFIGMNTYSLTATTVTIKTGLHYLARYTNASSYNNVPTSGYVRIVMVALQ